MRAIARGVCVRHGLRGRWGPVASLFISPSPGIPSYRLQSHPGRHLKDWGRGLASSATGPFGREERVRNSLSVGEGAAERDMDPEALGEALVDSIKRSEEEEAVAFITAGADVHSRDRSGSTLLILAAAKGLNGICGALLERHADVAAFNAFGSTCLMCAAANGHATTVGLLADHGADVNAQNRFGTTALMKAAAYGWTDVCGELLRRGADPSLSNKLGKTALDTIADKLEAKAQTPEDRDRAAEVRQRIRVLFGNSQQQPPSPSALEEDEGSAADGLHGAASPAPTSTISQKVSSFHPARAAVTATASAVFSHQQ